MNYFNLDITIMVGHSSSSEPTSSRGKDYPMTASFSKGGDASATMQFPFDEQTLAERLADVEQGLYNVQAYNRVLFTDKEESIQSFGRDLFHALFSGRIYKLFETVRQGLDKKNGERLRIRLRIHPPELAVLPWELMYDNDHDHPSYLCLDRSISLVRYQELRNPYTPLQVELPLYILGMVAVPTDQEPLNIRLERDAIRRQLRSLSRSMKLKWVRGSSWDDLQKAMGSGTWHIFHFIGHGSFNVSTNEGFIALADTNGNAVPVNARDLSLLLDHSSLRLVILNSCKGAFGGSADAFSSTASILARRNIPAIIAMQYQITDDASIRFAGAFYGTLAKGQPIDAALFEARLALKGIPFSMEWAIPVLHMRSHGGNLFNLTFEPLLPVISSKTTIPLLPVDPLTLGTYKTEEDSSLNHQTPSASPEGPPGMPFTLPPFLRKFSSRVYIILASIILFMLVSGYVLWPRPPSPNATSLCGGNPQSTSANTTLVNMPATHTSPDGEPIDLSDGKVIFDLQRSKMDEVQDKLQAAQANTTHNADQVVLRLRQAISSDPTDAEAQIYLENWKVLGSNHRHTTIVVGVSFAAAAACASRGALQGAFTAQKEYNDQNWQDNSKKLIVLMIANTGGGDSPDNPAKSANFVADQIFDQASKDPTIVGIMGWLRSADSINVNRQLKNRNSTLPMVSPISASDAIQRASNFFRVCPTNSEQAKVAANFILNKKQKKRIAIIYDSNTSFSQSLQSDFIENIPKANIIEPEIYKGGDSNALQDALNKVLVQNPDAIFFAGYVGDLPGLLNNIPQPNNLLIVGGDTLANTNAYKSLPSGLNNVYFTAFASPNAWDDINLKPLFFQEYRDNFGTNPAPTGLPSIESNTMLGYDAMLTLLHASQQALSKHNHTITPSYLEDEIKQFTGANAIQGVTGRIAFDSNGDQEQNKMIFVEHIEGTNLVIDERRGCLQKDKCGS